ncbi:Putative NADH-flavin reductase [Agromyces sp. CF514]|uniref:NAD(P)-dependent oxidoreductase n=1 Tax=Agromyces sp. CF514 TaxID=1881031 RepID=UPI0008F23FDB|nr:NAD(P)-binding oxidoreductase [Agromyces sp. CF514]SFR68352.1 Putative NADH-flavin reductase [Agromyces sp. CF514]
MTKKILIIGAAGNVGSRVVDAALAAGDEVVAYVRRPEAVAPRSGLTVVRGSAEEVEALAAAAAGADSVVVSITGSMSDATFMQRALPSIIAATRQAKAGRIVLVSVFGAGDTAELASGFARLVYRTALARFLADKAAADRLLVESGLEYTIVYPVNLKHAAALPAATVERLERVARVPGMPTLPYGNAGAEIARIAADPAYAGARVLLTSPKGWTAA